MKHSKKHAVSARRNQPFTHACTRFMLSVLYCRLYHGLYGELYCQPWTVSNQNLHSQHSWCRLRGIGIKHVHTTKRHVKTIHLPCYYRACMSSVIPKIRIKIQHGLVPFQSFNRKKTSLNWGASARPCEENVRLSNVTLLANITLSYCFA